MKPVVFIHGKKEYALVAKVSEYSLKRSSLSPDQFDVRTIFLEEYPALYTREGQKYFRDVKPIRWRNADPQSFVPLRFLVPKLMKYQGRALCIDPDIFALGDVYELLSRDMQGKSILCKRLTHPTTKKTRRSHYVSSVMLMDCRKLADWKWEEEIDAMFTTKKHRWNLWINLTLESPATIGDLEDEWNHYDTLNEQTKLLHNTRRDTQPWMTGLPYKRLMRFGEKAQQALIPEHWITGFKSILSEGQYLPFGRYEPNPFPEQIGFFFTLFREALECGFIDKNFVQSEIRGRRLRPDALELAETLGHDYRFLKSKQHAVLVH